MSDIILEVRNLSVYSGSQPLVEDISFVLKKGELTTIIGASGSGKSTILRAINRLADLESGLTVKGDIFLNGENVFTCCSVNDLRTEIGLVFQKPCIFPGSIYRNVLFGIRHHQKINKKTSLEIAQSVLQKAHLWDEVKDRLHKPASILSIGQKQRLAFARSLAVNPKIILLDEPTSSLDPHSTLEIEKALRELKETTTILLVTHLLDQGQRISDRIIFLSAKNGFGQIIEEGNTEDIFAHPQFEETKEYLLSYQPHSMVAK